MIWIAWSQEPPPSSGNTCFAELSLTLGFWDAPIEEYRRDQTFFVTTTYELRFVHAPSHNKMTLCQILTSGRFDKYVYTHPEGNSLEVIVIVQMKFELTMILLSSSLVPLPRRLESGKMQQFVQLLVVTDFLNLAWVSWDYWIHRLILCRGVRPHATNECSGYGTKTIWWWGSSRVGALGNAEDLFIAIVPGSTLARSGSTCLGSIYGSNRFKLCIYAKLNCLKENCFWNWNCVLMLNWTVWNRTVLTFNSL